MADETPTPEEEALSASATFENASADAGGAAERVLNQDEIDSLLGFDVGSEQAQDLRLSHVAHADVRDFCQARSPRGLTRIRGQIPFMRNRQRVAETGVCSPLPPG